MLWSFLKSGVSKLAIGAGLFAAADTTILHTGITQKVTGGVLGGVGKGQQDGEKEAGFFGFYKTIEKLAEFFAGLFGKGPFTQGMYNWAQNMQGKAPTELFTAPEGARDPNGPNAGVSGPNGNPDLGGMPGNGMAGLTAGAGVGAGLAAAALKAGPSFAPSNLISLGSMTLSGAVKGGLWGMGIMAGLKMGESYFIDGKGLKESAGDALSVLPFAKAASEGYKGNYQAAALSAGHDASAVVGGIGGAWAGAATGAAVGATVGSVVPLVGTAIGGFAGGIVGGLAGSGLGAYGLSFIFDSVADPKTTDVAPVPVIRTNFVPPAAALQ